MEIFKSDKRVTVELDGYSEYYSALVQGSITGRVSYPIDKVYCIKNDELMTMTEMVLRGDDEDWTKKFCPHVIRKLGHVQ